MISFKPIAVCTIGLLLLHLSAQAQSSDKISLLAHWQDTTLATSAQYQNTYNEVWGFVEKGVEYGVIGSTAGTHIFNLSDPADPQVVAMIPGAVQGPEVVHRDFHDYKGYLYIVCDEGTSTLQIVDLQYLPDSVEVVYDSNDLLYTAHNIFIDSATAKLYACSSTDGMVYKALAVFDLSNPAVPTLLEYYNAFSGQTIGGVHDAFVRNDTAYLNCGNEGLYVVDFKIPNDPQTIGIMDHYMQQGYNHSGWLHHTKPLYAMADENHGREVKLVDVADFNDMKVISTFSSGVDSFSIPHNQIIKGDYLYVSYYYDGLYIFDISNPESPVTAGFYDTSTRPHRNSYEGAWGVYPFLPSGIVLVSDMQNGLFVLDVSEALTSVPQINLPEIAVYPNPAQDHVYIDLTGINEPLEFQIINLEGKHVMDGNFSNQDQSIKINQLLAGVYFLSIRNKRVSYTVKIVKQ